MTHRKKQRYAYKSNEEVSGSKSKWSPPLLHNRSTDNSEVKGVYENEDASKHTKKKKIGPFVIFYTAIVWGVALPWDSLLYFYFPTFVLSFIVKYKILALITLLHLPLIKYGFWRWFGWLMYTMIFPFVCLYMLLTKKLVYDVIGSLKSGTAALWFVSLYSMLSLMSMFTRVRIKMGIVLASFIIVSITYDCANRSLYAATSIVLIVLCCLLLLLYIISYVEEIDKFADKLHSSSQEEDVSNKDLDDLVGMVFFDRWLVYLIKQSKIFKYTLYFQLVRFLKLFAIGFIYSMMSVKMMSMAYPKLYAHAYDQRLRTIDYVDYVLHTLTQRDFTVINIKGYPGSTLDSMIGIIGLVILIIYAGIMMTWISERGNIFARQILGELDIHMKRIENEIAKKTDMSPTAHYLNMNKSNVKKSIISWFRRKTGEE